MLGVSLLLVLFTLVFSVILTPYALNKSRDYLKKENFNSFLPTVRAQQFNDSFKGFTFFVESKVNNEVKKIFLKDIGSNLKNLQRYEDSTQETIVLAENGIIKNKNLFLLNGQIISKKNYDNNKKYNEN